MDYNRKKLLSYSARLTGIIFFILIFFKYDYKSIYDNIALVEYHFLFLSLLMFGPILFLRGFKTKYLVKIFESRITIKDSIFIWLIGLYLGSLTPGRIGDFGRAALINDKSNLSFGKSFFIVLIEKIFDFLLFSLIGFIGLTYLFGFDSDNDLFGFLIMLIIFLLGMSFVVFNRQLFSSFSRPLFKLVVPDKSKSTIRESYNEFHAAVEIFFSNSKTIMLYSFYSLICLSLIFLQMYILTFSFDLDINYTFFATFISIMIMVESVPISIFGIGVRDWTLIFLFSLYEISAELAVSFSMCALFMQIVISSSGYIVLINKY